MSVSSNDALFDATQTQEISSEDERERNKRSKIDALRLKTAQWIKKARLMADDNQLEEAKPIIAHAQSLLYDEDFVELDTLKSDLQRLLKLLKTKETYEKQGRDFALRLETSHDLAERGNEGPSSGTGKTIKMTIKTKREAPLEETKFKVTLEFSSNETPGLDLVTVLNTSATVQKLEKMKSAIQLVIKKLRPLDRLSIVTFSSHSNTLCPLHRMTEDSKAEIEMKVNDIAPCGGTNISAGLEKGLQELKQGCHESRRRVAIMLLCDGEQGPRNPDAAKVELGKVPLYTFGLGSNYDPEVLKAIVYNSSGRMFTYFQNVDELRECLDDLLRSAVQDLNLTINQESSTKIDKVSAENYSRYKVERSVIVSLGDLYEKEQRNVIVDLLLPDVTSTSCTDILRISYTHRSLGGELIHTNPIIVTITRRNSVPMINEARVVTEKQLKIANKMISKAQKSLQIVFDATLKSEVQQLKRLMNSQKLYDQQDSEEMTIDENGEGTIRSCPRGQTSTVQSNNNGINFPIEFLLDRTALRAKIPESLDRSNNYVSWRANAENILRELNLLQVINPSVEYIENKTRATELKQFRENWMALILINQACGFPINLQIIDLHSAKEAWETLATNNKQGAGGSDVDSFLSDVERGYWKKAERLLDPPLNLELAKARIPSSQDTVLHLASLAGEVNIVKKLVDSMVPQDLEIKDKDGYTALAKASIKGNKRIAQYMFEKNTNLVSIPTGTKLLPVVIAMMYGNKEMALYLYPRTPKEDLQSKGNINGATLLTYSIRRQFYDISFNLIETCSRWAVALDHNGQSALYQLACTRSAFRSGSKFKFWQKWLYNCVPVHDIGLDTSAMSVNVEDADVSESNCGNAGYEGIWKQIASSLLALLGIKRIYEMKWVHHHSCRLLDSICKQIKDDLDDHEINGIINALHEAAARGVVEFVVEVLRKFPEFRWLRDKEGSTIFMKAVQYRQADIFCLIHEFPSEDKMVVLEDTCGENILHKLQYSPVEKISTVQGGIIKMQKELKWFEEIKSMMPPDSLKKKNKKEKTAQELIAESHKQLISKAEKVMKDAANSCIIVGILVVTIMFAAAFTVPGGNNQDTGLPLFLKKTLFKIFIISDAVSLCFSTVSVLMFLAILTSRYAEKDFLEPLPRKLMIAILTLFISLTAMMIAFTATLFIMLRREFWSSVPITVLLTSLPVIFFALLFFPVLYECFRSTYGPSIFKRK